MNEKKNTKREEKKIDVKLFFFFIDSWKIYYTHKRDIFIISAHVFPRHIKTEISTTSLDLANTFSKKNDEEYFYVKM